MHLHTGFFLRHWAEHPHREHSVAPKPIKFTKMSLCFRISSVNRLWNTRQCISVCQSTLQTYRVYITRIYIQDTKKQTKTVSIHLSLLYFKMLAYSKQCEVFWLYHIRLIYWILYVCFSFCMTWFVMVSGYFVDMGYIKEKEIIRKKWRLWKDPNIKHAFKYASQEVK